jgi:hypothetical protein
MNSTTAKHKASASQSIRRNNGGTFANAGVWTGAGGGAALAGLAPTFAATAGTAAGALVGIFPGFDAGVCELSGFIL